jgi:hypothetical protein
VHVLTDSLSLSPSPRTLAEQACQELEASNYPSNSEGTSNTNNTACIAELEALRPQIASMEIELEESFQVTSECFSENTELKTNMKDLEEVVMRMTGLFEDSGLCESAKNVICADEDLSALIDELQTSPSAVDRVTKMHHFLKSQRNGLIEWIDEVSMLSPLALCLSLTLFFITFLK